jgi:hypothetical protein
MDGLDTLALEIGIIDGKTLPVIEERRGAALPIDI